MRGICVEDTAVGFVFYSMLSGHRVGVNAQYSHTGLQDWCMGLPKVKNLIDDYVDNLRNGFSLHW